MGESSSSVNHKVKLSQALQRDSVPIGPFEGYARHLNDLFKRRRELYAFFVWHV